MFNFYSIEHYPICNFILVHAKIYDNNSLLWIYENNEYRSNYIESQYGQIIKYTSSSELSTREKEKRLKKKLRHDSTWMQLDTPLNTAVGPNIFKARVIEIGESVRADANVGIEFGLARKMDLNMNIPHKWKKFGMHYNWLNGGIYHKDIDPLELVERCNPNDVVEWEITSENNDQGLQARKAVLKINGEEKGKSFILAENEYVYPTLHLASSGAKIEVGYHDMEYPEYLEGNLTLYSLYIYYYHKY